MKIDIKKHYSIILQKDKIIDDLNNKLIYYKKINEEIIKYKYDCYDCFIRNQENGQNRHNNYKCKIFLFKDMHLNKTLNNILYYSQLYDSVNEINNIKILDILKKEKIKITKYNIMKYKRLIERSFYLYNTYGNILCILNFDLNSMAKIYEKNWKYWLEYLNETIEMIKYLNNDI